MVLLNTSWLIGGSFVYVYLGYANRDTGPQSEFFLNRNIW